MKQQRIAFIGGGNMAAALVGGLLQDGYSADKIWVSNRSAEKLSQFQQLHVHTTTDNKQAVKNADIVVLAIKPQQTKLVCTEIAATLSDAVKLVVSIAPGVSCKLLADWLGKQCPIIRAMPNTPALALSGATGLYASDYVNDAIKHYAEILFRSVGIIVWVNDEKLMSSITAVSGSGPAYFFAFMEAMQNTAVAMGLRVDDAKLLTLQTALGAVKLALESADGLGQLRQAVTSPKGTTAAALDTFNKYQLNDIVAKAMQAAQSRAEEIRQELEHSELAK